jgi:hypothetical protein
VATGWDSLNANAYANRHGRFGTGGWSKAPGTHVELRAFLNLYNIAHSESAVDKGKSGRDANKSRSLLLPRQQKSEGRQGRRGLFAFFSQDGPGIRIHVMD